MSVRDKKILVVFLGILVVAAAFFLGYRPLNEKKATLEAENASLRDTYADLSMKASNADMYTKEIKMMNTKMEEIFTHYPSYLQTENEIMDAVSFEEITDAFIGSLTISAPVAVDTLGEGASAEGTGETSETSETGETGETGEAQTQEAAFPYQLYDVNSTITFESGYKGMKDLIDIIANDRNKKSVRTLSAVFDNTEGKITGNMSYDTYFIYGLDKPYVEPSVPEIKHGTKNIFGTVDTVDSEN